MFCPNYTNKEVFDGFNEIVEAFGGKPLTEDEFRSSELRMQRTGDDFVAMEAAYDLYDKNNGYFMDKTPSGEDSILFQQLLDLYNGDRKNAIIAKSNFYSDKFLKEYGVWTQQNSKFLSPSLDQVIVEAHDKPWKSDNSKVNETRRIYLKKSPEKGYFEVVKDFEDGFYSIHFKPTDSKNPKAFSEEEKNILFKSAAEIIPPGSKLSTHGEVSKGGIHGINRFESLGFNKISNRTLLMKDTGENVEVPIMYKSEEPSIEKIKKEIGYEYLKPTTNNKLQAAQINTIFEEDVANRLLDDQSVSSKSILSYFYSNNMFSHNDRKLYKILSKFNIPVVLGELEYDVLATTITDKKSGRSVIVINKNNINLCSKMYVADTVLHEVIHAITVNAINNPVTEQEKKFAEATISIYNKYNELLPEYLYPRHNISDGFYILENPKEFAAIFMSDQVARGFIYSIANRNDYQKNGVIKTKFKNFVNSLFNLFTNKAVFKMEKSVLDQYRNDFLSFLRSDSAQKYNLKNVYDNIDTKAAFYDKLFDSAKRLKYTRGAFERNNRRIEVISNSTPESIAQLLLTRLQLLNKSKLSSDIVSRHTQLIESQTDLILRDEYADKFQGIINIVQSVASQIIELEQHFEQMKDKSITDPETYKLTAEEYNMYKHIDVGTFREISKDINQLLNNTEFINDIAEGLGVSTTLEQKNEFINTTIREIKNTCQDIQSRCDALEADFILMLRDQAVADILQEVGEAVHDPGIERYIQKMNSIDFDDNGIFAKIGSLDNSKDSAAKTLFYLVSKANRKASNDSYEKAVKLLNQLDKLSSKKLQDLLYEKHNGKYTGFLRRKQNFGKFYDAYNKRLEEINREIRQKYNINLADDNRFPPDEEGARQEWYRLKNEWLSKNCHRRFINEYYEALGDLPNRVRRSLSTINAQIYQINNLPNITDENGKLHYENLSLEMWNKLQGLISRKKQLRNIYDEFGNKKTGIDLEDALALRQYYEKIYKDHPTFEKDVRGWETAKIKYLEYCGGADAVAAYRDGGYQKLDEYISSHKGFKLDAWNTWNKRNSRFQFKMDSDGKTPLVMKEIESRFGGPRIYYGEREQEIAEEIKERLRPYYGSNGFINDAIMSKTAKDEILKLIKKQGEERRRVLKNNKALKQQAAKYNKIFEEFIKFEETDEFKKIKQDVARKIIEAFEYFDYDIYIQYMLQYGTAWFDYDTQTFTNFKPHRWYTSMVAKDKYMWMEYVPGDSWRDENASAFKNKDFDESMHVTYIPKGQEYVDKQFEKEVVNNKELFKLYNMIHDTISEANDRMENRQHQDNYLLPQISGSMYRRIKAANTWRGKFQAFLRYIGEYLGIFKYSNEIDYGEDVDYDTRTESGEKTKSFSTRKHNIPLLKNMPDGRPMHIIPQPFTLRKNPENISANLIGITVMYYMMASEFKYKNDIKDQCEMIIDMMHDRQYTNKGAFSSQVVKMKGDQTNIYKRSTTYLEMNLYNIRKQQGNKKQTRNLNMQFDFNNMANILKRATTSSNLGANPKVAVVGFLTTMYNHIINAITGNIYSFKDAHNGGKAVIKDLVLLLSGARKFGNRITTNKTMAIAEKFDIADQFTNKIKGVNRNTYVDFFYRHCIYGMMTSLDFISKSSIAATVLNSFRYVDGQFMSEDQIYKKASYIENKTERDQYLRATKKEYKNAVKLYDVIYVKNGLFQVEDDYKDAFQDIEYIVEERIKKTASRADGLATKEQKAAITTSIIGSMALIHRQYLPLMIEERFSDITYDYDMQCYKNGQFKTLMQFLNQLALNNAMSSIGIAATLGFYIGGQFGVTPALLWAMFGSGAGFGYNRLFGNKDENGKYVKQSMKSITKQFFSNNETSEQIQLNRYKRKILKQVSAEMLMYKFVSLIVSIVCSIADEPDRRDDKWLQFLALVLRQVQWETFTPYRFDDVFNTFQSVSAATGVIDKGKTLFLNGMNLTVPIDNVWLPTLYSTLGMGTPTNKQVSAYKEMKKGPYKGLPRGVKPMIQLAPWSNMWEQYQDSYSKRIYQENKIMNIEK